MGERGSRVGVEISIYSAYSNSLFLSLYIVHTCIRFMSSLSTCLFILFKEKKMYKTTKILLKFSFIFMFLCLICFHSIFPQCDTKKNKIKQDTAFIITAAKASLFFLCL